MKNLKNRSISLLVLGLIVLTSFSQTTRAQDVAGRLAFGFDAGGNKYWGNYSDSRFDFQGDAFIRWNILDWLSLHAAYNGGVLQYKVTQASIDNENKLFNAPTYNPALGNPGNLGTLNHIREGGWELMASANVFPSQTFVPYFIGGLELLNFEPDDVGPSPLKGNANAAYSKNVLGGVLGVGFEMFISQKVTFNGKGLLHLTGTDWLDDYSSGATGGTQIGNGNNTQDAYLTMGLGFSYYLFAPDVVDAPPATGTTTIINNNYTTQSTIVHLDTVYIKDPTDTVYLVSPKVNTIFNFPGTLFIVNTDQFNSNEPNNTANLYRIKHLVDQCPSLKVEILGYASAEGTSQHNQELSERRATRIKTWLIEQGISSDKITATVGYGDTRPAVRERTDVSATELEAERTQNRRIAVRVVQACQ